MKRQVASLWMVLTLLTGAALLYSCSPSANGFLARGMHDLNAHYNAYWIAKEKVNETEAAIQEANTHNYYKTLKVFAPVDSTIVDGQKEGLEDAIKKASMVVQRHPNSDWLDDSFIELGWARYYLADFENAIKTFKYVNAKSEDDDARHAALVALIRTYVDYNEASNAREVAQYLAKEAKISKTNRRNYYLTSAYLYQTRNDAEALAENLEKAVKLMPKGESRATCYYILGQLAMDAEKDDEAYRYFKACVKSRATYEMAFYAKLNMAQVKELDGFSDLRKTRRFYKKLLKDDKNTEFQDKIYYDMGEFELKNDSLPLAIDHYKSSVKVSTSNQRQKSYGYLRLGQIYYERLKNYELAKAYYDSTVAVMPKDEEQFAAIQKRQEILGDFVEQITIIRTQDSLLRLASMDSSALVSLFDQVLAQREADEQKAAKEERRRKRIAAANQNAGQQNTGFNNGGFGAPGPSQGGSAWYFENPASVSQGQAAFQQRWGNRPLEDDWRRSKKANNAAPVTGANTQNPALADNAGADNAAQTATDDGEADADAPSAEAARAGEIARMIQSLPKTPEARTKALGLVDEAHYKLGKIYYFNLEEPANADHTFDTMLVRFPASPFKPEVLYLLYRINKDSAPERAEGFKQQLLTEFPDSDYAKLIVNPNYRQENELATAQARVRYNEAFRLYSQGKPNEALALIKKSLEEFPETGFSDNLNFLQLLINAEQGDINQYKYAVGEYIKNNEESELVPFAQKTLAAAEALEKEMQQRKGVKYFNIPEATHYFVVMYPQGQVNTDTLSGAIENFHSTYWGAVALRVNSLVFDEGKSMLLVTEFANQADALSYYQDYKKEKSPLFSFSPTPFDYFIISKENFRAFYENKDLNGYLRYFNAEYQ